MLTKDTAICIRAVDFSETSQIVTFFARASGKVSVIAKGSKRPKSAFDGPIEILSFGKIVFTNSTKEKLATLTEFQAAYGGPGLANLPRDLFTLNCGLFAAELVNHLTHDYDPHPELFDSFLQFLKSANEQQATGDGRRDMLGLLIVFQLALLKEVGLRPILNMCGNCKTGFDEGWPESYFSSSANGLVCRDCEPSFPDKIRLTKNAAACLTDLKQLAESQEKTLNEIERLLVSHFTELLGHRPKMAKHILDGILSS
jgi:DNA repair protein RecO (recombination protein O)